MGACPYREIGTARGPDADPDRVWGKYLIPGCRRVPHGDKPPLGAVEEERVKKNVCERERHRVLPIRRAELQSEA